MRSPSASSAGSDNQVYSTHLYECACDTVLRGGSSVRQSGLITGQRGWMGQPGGGWRRDVASPFTSLFFTFSSGMKVTVWFREEESLLHQSKALRPEASCGGLASGGAWVAKASEMSAFYKTTLGIPIYLNSESEMGLTAIPGIGLGLAKAIVEERTKRGGFKSLDELLSVNGIGEKLYRKVTPYLTTDERYRKKIHPPHPTSQM